MSKGNIYICVQGSESDSFRILSDFERRTSSSVPVSNVIGFLESGYDLNRRQSNYFGRNVGIDEIGALEKAVDGITHFVGTFAMRVFQYQTKKL